MERKWGKEKMGTCGLAQTLQTENFGRLKSGGSFNYQHDLWSKTLVEMDKRAQSSMGKTLEREIYPRLQQSGSN